MQNPPCLIPQSCRRHCCPLAADPLPLLPPVVCCPVANHGAVNVPRHCWAAYLHGRRLTKSGEPGHKVCMHGCFTCLSAPSFAAVVVVAAAAAEFCPRPYLVCRLALLCCLGESIAACLWLRLLLLLGKSSTAAHMCAPWE